MKIVIDHDEFYLDPIEIGDFEHVTVLLPNGMGVRVFSDKVYVFSKEDAKNHKDGRRVWSVDHAPSE